MVIELLQSLSLGILQIARSEDSKLYFNKNELEDSLLIINCLKLCYLHNIENGSVKFA